MGVKVGLGVLHLLLWCEAIHVSHQRRCHCFPPVASSSTVDWYAISPCSDLCSSSHGCHMGQNPALSEGHGFPILILHHVNLLQHLPLPKVLQGNSISHSYRYTERVHTWSVTQAGIKHEKQTLIHCLSASILYANDWHLFTTNMENRHLFTSWSLTFQPRKTLLTLGQQLIYLICIKILDTNSPNVNECLWYISYWIGKFIYSWQVIGHLYCLTNII